MRSAMKFMILSLTISLTAIVATTSAQQPTEQSTVSEYSESVGVKSPQQIIREKAQVRAAQRMTRMAALEWYGYSVARPRTNATPFTSMYGGQWQGDILGRPSAWHTNRHVSTYRPTVVVGY